MKPHRHLLAFFVAVALSSVSLAQSAGPSTLLLAPVAPPFSSPPEVYSGISGPGKPLIGNGAGGYRSGYEGVMFDGPDAEKKPGWLPLGQYACTSAAVKEELLPPIKPIWDLHLRDTVICVGPDGDYYMTGSSGDNIWDRNDGIEIWGSPDLKTWSYLGLVWSFERDGTWQKKWGVARGKPTRNIWAPELHYLRGKKNYYLTYSLAGGGGTGLLVSTTGKPEGPYATCLKPDARLTGGIDATLFEDDDGKVYMTWGRGGSIAQLKDDMSGFEIPPKVVPLDKSDAVAPDGTTNIPADPGNRKEVAMEGATLFKHGGKYYLGGTKGGGCYDAVTAISDNIWGPYKHWHVTVPCGRGGGYFQAKDGNWYLSHFGNDEATPFREKPGIVKIEFAPDGKIRIADEQPAFILQDGAATRWRKK